MVIKHYVVCKKCGVKFDYKSTGGYYDGNRYVCKNCANKEIRYENALRENNRKGLPADAHIDTRTWFQKYWKIAIGGVLLLGGFGNLGKDNSSATFGLLIGLCMIIWYVLPMIVGHNSQKKKMKAHLEAEKKRGFICKRCGAVTHGEVCEHCGSPIS